MSLIGRISDYFHVNAKPTDDLAIGYMRELDAIIVAPRAAPQPSPDIAEECAKIAESHVGACNGLPYGPLQRSSYDEACRDIAKAIRDALGDARSASTPETSGNETD